MKRALPIIFLLLLLLAGTVTFIAWTGGRTSLSISDVSRSASASAYWSINPLHGGQAFVIVEGELDQDAVLEVSYNDGKSWENFPLHEPSVSLVTGGSEAWVKSVHIRYDPKTAKKGHLYIALYCGTNFTPADRARYERIILKARKNALAGNLTDRLFASHPNYVIGL